MALQLKITCDSCHTSHHSLIIGPSPIPALLFLLALGWAVPAPGCFTTLCPSCQGASQGASGSLGESTRLTPIAPLAQSEV